MSKLSEGTGVEIPVYGWLGKMGWTSRTSADLKVYNRPLSNPLIEGILIERVSKINGVSLADAKRAVDILKHIFANPSVITANEDFLDLLCAGVNLTIEGEDRTLKLIDFDNVWNNDFTVTRQYLRPGHGPREAGPRVPGQRHPARSLRGQATRPAKLQLAERRR